VERSRLCRGAPGPPASSSLPSQPRAFREGVDPAGTLQRAFSVHRQFGAIMAEALLNHRGGGRFAGQQGSIAVGSDHPRRLVSKHRSSGLVHIQPCGEGCVRGQWSSGCCGHWPGAGRTIGLVAAVSSEVARVFGIGRGINGWNCHGPQIGVHIHKGEGADVAQGRALAITAHSGD